MRTSLSPASLSLRTERPRRSAIPTCACRTALENGLTSCLIGCPGRATGVFGAYPGKREPLHIAVELGCLDFETVSGLFRGLTSWLLRSFPKRLDRRHPPGTEPHTDCLHFLPPERCSRQSNLKCLRDLSVFSHWESHPPGDRLRLSQGVSSPNTSFRSHPATSGL